MWSERLAVLCLAAGMLGSAAAPAAAEPPPAADGETAASAGRGARADANLQPDADERDAGAGPVGLPGWFSWFPGRFAGHVNGVAQSGRRNLTDMFGFRAYGEQAVLQSTHTLGGAGALAAGGSLRLWRGLLLGASYAQLRTSDATLLTGTVPHPIRHGAFRELPPQDLSFPHRQHVTHVFFAWRVPIVDRVDLSLFLGPSLYNVTQGVVTNVTVREAGGPPFASVQVDTVQAGEHRRNAVGGHAGFDLTFMPTRHLGVGLTARYAIADIDLPAAGTGRLRLRVGGPEVGAGIRLRF